MGWQSEEFGSSHEGRVGVLLDDGSEPGPVYVDVGSGAGGRRITDWWVYDGQRGTQRAAFLRGACSCDWRGRGRYPVDWAEVTDWPNGIDTSGPEADWSEHIKEVQARSIPLPAGLDDLLERLDSQLIALADDAPLAALRAVTAIERTAERVGRAAAENVYADDMPWDAVGRALGLTEKDARSRLIHYRVRR